MMHIDGEGPDLSLPEDGSIPAFLKVENRPPEPVAPQRELSMRNDTVKAVYAADETAAAEAPAADTPASKPAKAAKPRAKKAAGNGASKPAAKAKGTPKAAKKATPKATAKATKGKAKAERQRDPAKLDQFGFRKGSIKSNAAALYVKGKGATLAEVKDVVGSVQFNLLTELEEKGFKVEVDEVKNSKGRMVNRYKLHAKA